MISDNDSGYLCNKCGGNYHPARALVNTTVAAIDFSDIDIYGDTLSRSGPAKMVDCMKCESCGHSFIPFLPSLPHEGVEDKNTAWH